MSPTSFGFIISDLAAPLTLLCSSKLNRRHLERLDISGIRRVASRHDADMMGLHSPHCCSRLHGIESKTRPCIRLLYVIPTETAARGPILGSRRSQLRAPDLRGDNFNKSRFGYGAKAGMDRYCARPTPSWMALACSLRVLLWDEGSVIWLRLLLHCLLLWLRLIIIDLLWSRLVIKIELPTLGVSTFYLTNAIGLRKPITWLFQQEEGQLASGASGFSDGIAGLRYLLGVCGVIIHILSSTMIQVFRLSYQRNRSNARYQKE